MSNDKIRITESSGNVFEDLGLPNAKDLQFKAGLVIQIARLITSQQLTQVQAARLLGIPQPKLSALMRGDFTGFSTDRLFRILQTLGQNIEIKLSASPVSQPIGIIHVLADKPLARKVKRQAAAKKTPKKPAAVKKRFTVAAKQA